MEKKINDLRKKLEIANSIGSKHVNWSRYNRLRVIFNSHLKTGYFSKFNELGPSKLVFVAETSAGRHKKLHEFDPLDSIDEINSTCKLFASIHKIDFVPYDKKENVNYPFN